MSISYVNSVSDGPDDFVVVSLVFLKHFVSIYFKCTRAVCV